MLKRKPIILVDMDGVLCDFNKKLTRLAHERFGAPLLKAEELTEFRTEEHYDEPVCSLVAKLSDEEGFFEDLDSIEGAVDAVHEMNALGYRVFICTTPKKFFQNPSCAGNKHAWVMKHLGKGWTERVILTRDKTLVYGDVLIDDKPEVTGAITPFWKHVYFDQAYNRDNMNRPRITSWKDWKHVIASL